jgi:hypothetical protein
MDAPFRFLHRPESLNRVKLVFFRSCSTSELISSLRPGEQGSLKARNNGTVLDGHHRLQVLLERGVACDSLPRKLIEQETDAI